MVYVPQTQIQKYRGRYNYDVYCVGTVLGMCAKSNIRDRLKALE